MIWLRRLRNFMKKIIFSLTTLFTILFIFLAISESSFNKSELIWNKTANGIKEENVNYILIDSKDVNKIFVATDRAVYLSTDNGNYYRKVLNISGGNSQVNFLFQDKNSPEIIFAATS